MLSVERITRGAVIARQGDLIVHFPRNSLISPYSSSYESIIVACCATESKYFCSVFFREKFTIRENVCKFSRQRQRQPNRKHFLFPAESFTLPSFVLATLRRRQDGKIRKMLSFETTSGSKKHWKLLWKIIIRIHIANNIMTYSQFSYRTQPRRNVDENPGKARRRKSCVK